MPVACLLTDTQGVIRHANVAAALLLNVSSKALQTRLLTHFAIDREPLLALLARQSGDRVVNRMTFRLRPRERSIVLVDVTVVLRVGEDDATWLWFVVPATQARQSPASMRVEEAASPV